MIRTVRFGLIIVLAVAMSAVAFGQTFDFTLRKPSIVGCVQSSKGTSSLIDEQDNRTYVLVSDHVALPKSGERFKLQGKKIEGAGGKYTFNVKKVGRDYGPCQVMIVR